MEAPKKIYMPTELLSEDWSKHIKGCDIEYVRKDVFIERARKAMIALLTFPFMSKEEIDLNKDKIDLICDILEK